MSFGGGPGSALIIDELVGAGAEELQPQAQRPHGGNTRVQVHPMVLFCVLDHFLRRPEHQKRVIGSLLGTVNAGVVEITNCFAVPHMDKDDEVAVGKDFNKQMYALQQRVNPREKIVGWYATTVDGVHVTDNSSLIHEFYTDECDSPVHLVVDTSMAGNTVGCRAYVSTPLEIQGSQLGNAFHEVPLEVEAKGAEKICLDRMARGQEQPFSTSEGRAAVAGEATSLEASLRRLLETLRTISTYVDGIVAGKTPADPQVGRRIADALAVVPQMKPEAFAKLFDSSLQDLLMVSYLTSLTRTQLAIAEKLTV